MFIFGGSENHWFNAAQMMEALVSEYKGCGAHVFLLKLYRRSISITTSGYLILNEDLFVL